MSSAVPGGTNPARCLKRGKMNDKYTFLAGYGQVGTKDIRGKRCTVVLCREAWHDHQCWAIRCFEESGRPNRGISLTAGEIRKLRDLLNEIPEEEIR